ncbi:5-oxoprolinase subunit C family protein [Nocardioides islandensis]|nr:biotin-dependent carboxyltransferase family protein [Nocardioides islandensis]
MARALTVVDAGPLTTVQDAGRPGLAHLGVPRSGFLDDHAARLANRLVGNEPGAALLETTLGGVTLRTGEAVTVAVTGAVADVLVDGRGAPWSEPLSVPAGAVLAVGPARSGVRTYVAVAGGIEVDPVLGSRSTDTLSGLGPPVVADGDVLPVGAGRRPRPADVPRLPAVDGPLRVTPGPRESWVEGGVRRLAEAGWTVAADSNRVALRLHGEPLQRAVEGELPSEGLVLGAVQVPPDGQPLVFLADHPTTGGYPVVGVLHPDDLWRCAQLRPGEPVSLRQVAG